MSDINSFQGAFELAQTRKRKLANNTYLNPHADGSIGIRFHATDVVTYFPDGSVTLDSGGWTTATTKTRMNEFMPEGWGLNSERGVWMLSRAKRVEYDAPNLPTPRREGAGYFYTYDENGPTYAYADGVRLWADGRIEGAGEDPKKARKLRASINCYVKSYMRAFCAGVVPAPSGGDCWNCLMTSEDGKAVIGGADHILSHIKEGYFVPSLLVRACERFAVSDACRQWIAAMWVDTEEAGDPIRGQVESILRVFGDIGEEQATRALRRYCAEQCKLPS